MPRYGLRTTSYNIASHRTSHCPSTWKHISLHPMKIIMQKMGSWQNDHADNERCPMAPRIHDLRPVLFLRTIDLERREGDATEGGRILGTIDTCRFVLAGG